jgi:formate hydrogenlyase subunit 4
MDLFKNVNLNPSKLTNEQLRGLLRTALYLMASAALTALTSYVSQNEALFNPMILVAINWVLVFLKKVFTKG